MTAADIGQPRIAVFGGGQVGLLAATALARALPDYEILLIRTPVAADAFADTAHTTLPSLLRLHRRLGIPELSMLRHALASHWLATRYTARSRNERVFTVGHGAAAEPQMVRAGIGRSLGDMSATVDQGPAATLSRAGAFALPSDDVASPLSDLDYALRFDPAGHVRGLLALSRQLGVRIIDADIGSVVRPAAAMIREVVLTDGSIIRASLYADCTGTRRALIGDAGWVNWSSAIPLDRVVGASTPAAVSPLDEIIGSPAAIDQISPGRDATRRVRCWSSTFGAPDDALNHETVRIDAGRLGTAWSQNVIALGDCAAAFPPIAWINLHLAVVGIELMLDLLPGRGPAGAERDEFNRRFADAADRVADFVAAHVALTAIAHEPSVALAQTLSEFQRRSRLPPFEEQTVSRELWSQLLAGLLPDAAVAPRVRAMDPADRAGHARAVRDRATAALAMSKPYPVALQEIIEGHLS